MEMEEFVLGEMKDFFLRCTTAYENGDFTKSGDYAHDVIELWKRHFSDSAHEYSLEAHEMHLAALMMFYKCSTEWSLSSAQQRLHNAVEQRLVVHTMSKRADAGNEYLQRVLRIRAVRFRQRHANRRDDEIYGLPRFS